MRAATLPGVVDLINPTLQALRQLGGAGTIDEIRDQVADILELSPAQLQATYTSQGKEYSRINKRIDWAKVYLGTTRYIEKLDSGQWALTDQGKRVEVVDGQEVLARARSLHRR